MESHAVAAAIVAIWRTLDAWSHTAAKEASKRAKQAYNAIEGIFHG